MDLALLITVGDFSSSATEGAAVAVMDLALLITVGDC